MDSKSIVAYARGDKPVDLVIKNAKIVNVFTGTIVEDSIAIAEGFIVGIGNYEGKAIIDAKGDYIAPGFIDAHVHIESSLLTPQQFSKVIVPKGTTTIIADPHEIANVSGEAGINYLLKASQGIPLNVFMMIPSCVPATELENAGAVIDAHAIARFKSHPNVLGLGEVMDYPAVISGDSSIHQKMDVMKKYPIDGHAPDIVGHPLNAYIAAGVMTDHECTTVEAMQARLERGMFVHLREGSATRNVRTLLHGVTKRNHARCLFCTDDKHPEDIEREGHINFNVNLAIAHGIDPIDAIRMATLNTAQCYHLKSIGGIAPGYKADLIIFEDLKQIEPHTVFKDGVKVAKEGKALFDVEQTHDDSVMNTVHIDLDKIDFSLPLSSPKVHVIGLIKNNITTQNLIETVTIKQGLYQHDEQRDLLKIAVIERHKKTNNIGIGLLKGYGIKDGAVAMSIAHDSHNVIVVGDSDSAMKRAVDELVRLQGGIVVVKADAVCAALQLEISGIMSTHSKSHVTKALVKMTKIVENMGLNPEIDDPFITLAFLSLPVIPALKLTDRGLFDVEIFSHIPIEVKKKG